MINASLGNPTRGTAQFSMSNLPKIKGDADVTLPQRPKAEPNFSRTCRDDTLQTSGWKTMTGRIIFRTAECVHHRSWPRNNED
jgi:hypothetical protein